MSSERDPDRQAATLPGDSGNSRAGSGQSLPIDAAPPEDTMLVRSVLAQEQAAFDRFVVRMRCIPRILGSLNARIGRPLDEHELADLGQEVLIVVWRKLSEFDGKSSLESWVYRIAFYTLMNAVRSRRRRGIVALGFEETHVAGREGERESPWDVELLHSALQALPEAERELLELKHFEELTFVEIGERQGISDNTAKTRYYRARVHLQQQLRGAGSAASGLATGGGTP